MSEEKLRKQLYDSFANRAHIYHLIFNQLRDEIGTERTAELMGRAIYQRGVQKGTAYAAFAPRDLQGLKEAFVGGLPDNGAMFAPEVIRCDADGLDIKFHRCPLKQAWLDAGLGQEEVARLCRIAAQVDQGMFEAAGFRFHADTYQPGAEGCCFLHIRPRTSCSLGATLYCLLTSRSPIQEGGPAEILERVRRPSDHLSPAVG